MKIFVISSNLPRPAHSEEGVTAIHIQLYELLTEFVKLGHKITLQVIFNRFHENHLSETEEKDILPLKTKSVDILEPIFSNSYRKDLSNGICGRAREWSSLFTQPPMIFFYPSVKMEPVITERIRASGSDLVFTFGSPEGVGAVFHFNDIPKIAYQGDVDFHPDEIRFSDPQVFEKLVFWKQKLLDLKLNRYKQAHWAVMSKIDAIANATFCNAAYYERHGHQNSLYVGPCWPDEGFRPRFDEQNPRQKHSGVVKIIGHVGNLANTGSTYGLKYLLQEIVPRLTSVLSGISYEVHIIGAGKIVPSLSNLLKQPNVLVRGWVSDLEHELYSSDVFLFLNNAGRLIAAYSRHLVAWSMGLCLIVHANSQKAIPEIEHLQNALVGETPDEIIKLIRDAVTNKALNRRIREGGRQTYEKEFSPQASAGKFLRLMERLLTPEYRYGTQSSRN